MCCNSSLPAIWTKWGNTAVYVIVNLKTKHVDIFPTPAQTEEAAALATFTYICTYSMVDAIQIDPGSELTSNGLKQLNAWLGLGHQLSLVDVHEFGMIGDHRGSSA